MDIHLLIFLVVGLLFHIGMVIYYFLQPPSRDRRVILTMLTIMILSSLYQLFHLKQSTVPII